MKHKRVGMIIAVLGWLAWAGEVSFATDTYLPFSLSSLTLTVPTNTTGYVSDPANQVGPNAVYHVTGQTFNYQATIQTIAQGYDGVVDTTTPWRTLTALLAAYQQGAHQSAIDALYNSTGQSFINSIYSSPSDLSNFQSFTGSIQGMTVILGYNLGSGFVGLVLLQTTGGNDLVPYYFMQVGGHYLLTTFTSNANEEGNIAAYYGTGVLWGH